MSGGGASGPGGAPLCASMTISSEPVEPVLNTQNIALGLTSYVVLLFSLSVHESAHAWTALKQGDPRRRRSAGSASTRSSTST